MTKPQTPDEGQNSIERDDMPENCKCECQCTQDVPKPRAGCCGRCEPRIIPQAEATPYRLATENVTIRLTEKQMQALERSMDRPSRVRPRLARLFKRARPE